MNEVVVVEVRRAADGRLYPARPLDEAEQGRARVLAHSLVCRDGLSYRAAQQALLANGIRRSLGWLSHTLSHYSCERPACPCVPIEPGPQLPASQAHAGGG